MELDAQLSEMFEQPRARTPVNLVTCTFTFQVFFYAMLLKTAQLWRT